MERLRRKRSTSNVNPDFGHVSQGSLKTSTFLGNGQFQNPRNFPKPASDSSSCSSGIPDEDTLTFELGLRSWKQTPMKKLLAKEMSKETESRRRSPGVVAKLMGLDALPPQHHHRTSSKDEQLFKDVFEVLEPPSNPDIRQKFMDDPKEFHEALDSNKDLLLKFLQQPDSLFAKHLHDLQGATSHPRMLAMKPPQDEMYESVTRPAREPKSQHRPSHIDCCEARTSLKMSQPTRIVVLKPNLGKLLNDSRKDRQVPLLKKREVEVSGRRKIHRDGGISGHKSKESRDLAKEITRQMRDNFGNSSARLSSAVFKGYAGDESSCTMSGNESANEVEVASTSSKYSYHLSNHSRSLSSESSVSREAKKRLSERWKLNHRSQEMRTVSRGSTLADMLAISDKEKRPVHSDADGFRNKSCRDDRQPLGISSRDGWKDGCMATLTRSRSLPSSSTVYGSPKAIIREDRYVIVKEAYKRERHRGLRTSVDWNSRSISTSTTSFPSRYIIRETDDTSPEQTHATQNQVELEVKVNSLPDLKLDNIESLSGIVTDRSPVNVERETAICSTPVDNSLPEASSGALVADDCKEGDCIVTGPLQEPPMEPHVASPSPLNRSVPGSESPASSKEADQPSPVSVLAVPFTDDLSSCSDCFESLNADLQGLRMQLQLLKLESESYEEGPMVLSSDEDIGEVSTGFFQQSWESCYVVNALIHSGLDDADPDVFLAAWHTAECPISPSVFEKLEKEYHDQTSQPKSERKLLFDRINYSLLEMYQQFNDSHPWVRSSATLFSPRWPANELQDCLLLSLASQEKNAKKDAAGNVLGSEAQWLDIRDDIEVIGRDIEKLLYDELVGEFAVDM